MKRGLATLYKGALEGCREPFGSHYFVGVGSIVEALYMKFQMFSIYDGKAAAYLPPWFVPNVPVAVRSFSNCANDPGHQFCVNAEDYTLFHLGEFDSEVGHVLIFPTAHVIGKALQFKKPVSGVVVPDLKVVS